MTFKKLAPILPLAALCGLAVLVQPGCSTSGAKATAIPTATANAANATWTPLSADTVTNTISPTATRTITRTPTLSNTRTLSWTPSQTYTYTDSPTPCTTPQGTTVTTINVDCWNTSGGCLVCGNTAYACTPFTNTCAFTDPCPGGQAAVQIVANVFGLACTTGAGFDTSCNGTAIGSTTNATYLCSCGTCTIWCHDSGYYGGGFPGYVSGGTNNFAFSNIVGQFCMSYVTLSIGCQ